MLFVTSLYLPEESPPAPTPIDATDSASEPAPKPQRISNALLAQGRLLVSSGVSLRVHTSPDLESELLASWEGLSTDRVELRTDVLVEPYWQSNVSLPKQRNESYDTAFHLSVQLSKLKLCALAAESSQFVAWVDYNVFGMIKNVEVTQENLRSVANLLPVSNRNRLLSPTAWAPGDYSLWHVPCWRHLGGFLIGPGSAFVAAYEKQLNLVVVGLPMLTWEVNYWAMMDGDFDGYPAYRDDSLIANALTMI